MGNSNKGKKNGEKISSTTSIHICLIVILCLVAYFNSLFNQFTYDDNVIIVDNYLFRNLENLPRLFGSAYFNYAQELTYRPIVTISYLVDYVIWGLRPFGYHLTNLLLHILTAITVYSLLKIIVRDAYMRPLRNYIAFWGAILFSVHPVNTEAVNAIAFREDLIATLFYLLGLLFYIKSSVGNAYMRPLRILSVLCYLIAMFAKEMAVTLIIVILMYDVLMSSKPVGDTYVGCLQNIKKNIGKYTLYCIALIFYLIVRFIILKNPDEGTVKYIGENFFVNVLTMIKILGSYLLQMLIPIGLSADYTIRPIESPFNLSFLISLTGIVAIILIGIIFRKKNPIISFFIFFFFIGLLPVMNFIPISNPRADRYLYLVSILYCAILSMSIVGAVRNRFADKVGNGRDRSLRIFRSGKELVIPVLMGIIVIFYIILTIQRNRIWRDDITLWEDTLKKYPNSKRANANLGREYLKKGELNLALEKLQKAVALEENNYMAYVNLGIVYSQLEQYDSAIEALKKAVKIFPNYDKTHNTLGNLYIKKKEFNRALESYQKAVKINPEFAEAYCNMGNAYMELKLYKEAEASYTKALEIDKNFYGAFLNLGTFYTSINQDEKALECFNKALNLKPNSYRPLFNMGIVKLKMDRPDEAILIFTKAELLNSEDANLYYYMGVAYNRLNDINGAIRSLKKAIELKPNHTDAHFNLGVLYAQNKKYDEAVSEFEKTLQLKPDSKQAQTYLAKVKRLKDEVKKN